MANIEVDQYLGELLSAYARLKQTLNTPAGTEPIPGVQSLVYTPSSLRKVIEQLRRGLRKFGTDVITIGVLLIVKKRAKKLCTLVYFTNAYLELQDQIRRVVPEFTFSKEEERVFQRVATLINGELPNARN